MGCSGSSRYQTGDSDTSGAVYNGFATYYADSYQGKQTSSGDYYDRNLFTAAHPFLPFNTIVLVTNLKNNRSVKVKINDRFPGTKNRIIDLSYRAALELDMIRDGIVEVTVKVIKE